MSIPSCFRVGCVAASLIAAFGGTPPADASSITPVTLDFELEGLDLDSGTVLAIDPWPSGSEPSELKPDFVVGRNPERAAHAVVLHNRMTGVEVAFLDSVPFNLVESSDLESLIFTTEIIDQSFDLEDSVVVRTDKGNHYLLGNPIEDASGITFDTQLLRQTSAGLTHGAAGHSEQARDTGPPQRHFVESNDRGAAFAERSAAHDPTMDQGTAESVLVGPLLINEDFKLLLDEPRSGDAFGFSVSVDGDTLIAGALGDEELGGTSNAGAAYVFVRDADGWSQQDRLSANDSESGDFYGGAVAVQGNFAVVGAFRDHLGVNADAGSIYIYIRLETGWFRLAKRRANGPAPNDNFGRSVAISGDTIVAGSPFDDHSGGTNAGSAYVFEYIEDNWVRTAELQADDAAAGDQFGHSVAISHDTIVVGAFRDSHEGGMSSGSAYVFVRSEDGWIQQAKLTAGDAVFGEGFGISVAIDSDTVVAGAFSDDTPDGGNAGSAYIFVRSESEWFEETKLTASDGVSNDNFGYAVTIFGEKIVVGAIDGGFLSTGAAYVFRRDETWQERAILTPADWTPADTFGEFVALSGDTVVVGDPREDPGPSMDTGAAYVFELMLPTCGDGIIGLGEECDDGNNVNDDGCEADCVLPDCGQQLEAPDSLFSFGVGTESNSFRGLDVDEAGNVYIADDNNERVRAFDAAGGFLFQIGGIVGSEDGQFKNPADVAVDAAGRIHVADEFNHRVQVFDSSGNFLFKFGSFGGGDGQFDRPLGVAVDSAGRIIIADTGNDRIQVFDQGGDFLFEFGESGNGDGQFGRPKDVFAVDTGQILVLDFDQRRVQVFDDSGVFQFAFGGPTELWNPSALVVDDFGRIYVANTTLQRINVYGPLGNLLLEFGGLGDDPGELRNPQSIAIAPGGEIYVGESGNQRVQVFRAFEADRDADGIVDCGDACPDDPGNDLDGDGVCAIDDNCPNLFNPEQLPDTTLPDVTPPPSLTVECAGEGGTAASNPEISAWLESTTATDECGELTLTNDAPDVFPLGTTVVAFTAEDESGNVSTQFSDVEVVDTVPPTVSVSVTPATLWPPNHKMVDVEAFVTVSDVCGAPGVVLSSVTSNEADNGVGDGNTVDDIQGAELGFEDTDFELRAERAGGGNGRIYAVVYTVTDVAGNTSSAAAHAVVPHDQDGVTDPVEIRMEDHGEGTVVRWDTAEGAQSYDVIRGQLGRIEETEVVISLGAVTCVEVGSTDLSTAGWEDPAVPGPGAAFFYLVEYFDGTSSSYGTESADKPRAPGPGDCHQE